MLWVQEKVQKEFLEQVTSGPSPEGEIPKEIARETRKEGTAWRKVSGKLKEPPEVQDEC